MNMLQALREAAEDDSLVAFPVSLSKYALVFDCDKGCFAQMDAGPLVVVVLPPTQLMFSHWDTMPIEDWIASHA